MRLQLYSVYQNYLILSLISDCIEIKLFILLCKKIYPKFLFVDRYNQNILSSLNKNIDIIYRNYQKKIDKKTLRNLKLFCKKSNRKFYIANNLKLAIQLNTDGIYIPSFNKKINFSNINTYKKFHFIGSAHNKKEIKIKISQNCKFIFLLLYSIIQKIKKILILLNLT